MNIRKLHCNVNAGFPVRKREHVDFYKVLFFPLRDFLPLWEIQEDELHFH